jgi:hypothetical protein
MATSLLYDGVAAALADALSVAGQKFTWNGQRYDCIVSAESNSLVTSKALFSGSQFPLWGAVIEVAGKRFQVTALANGTLEFVSGGLESTGTEFIDDPENPSLVIKFASLHSG